ncbi:MAG TPA: CHASE2 domain-containing protein [bacterium]|nr:CHASE2 domain-containing protein [bacterium]
MNKKLLIIFTTILMAFGCRLSAQDSVSNLRWPATPNPISDIAIVGIDDATMYYLGPASYQRQGEIYRGSYPLHRVWFGELTQKLREAGARIIAFDQLFIKSWKNYDDQSFSKIIADGPPPILIGFESIPGPLANSPEIDMRRFALPGIRLADSKSFTAGALALPARELLDSGAAPGCLTDQPDADNVFRHSNLYINYNGYSLPSLSLAIFMQTIGISPAEIRVYGSGTNRYLSVRGRSIQISSKDTLQVAYPPHNSIFKFYSFYDVVKVKDDFKKGAKEAHAEKMKEYFQDKIVIVGYNDMALNDWISTPVGGAYPGVEALAASVNHLLNLYSEVDSNWRSKMRKDDEEDSTEVEIIIE